MKDGWKNVERYVHSWKKVERSLKEAQKKLKRSLKEGTVLFFLEKEGWKKEIKKEGNKDSAFSNWKKLFHHLRSFSLRLFKEGFEKKEGMKKKIRVLLLETLTLIDII